MNAPRRAGRARLATAATVLAVGCGSEPASDEAAPHQRPDGGEPAKTLEGGPEPPTRQLTTERLAVEDWPAYVTDFAFLPGRAELLALDKAGKVLHLALEGDALVRLGEFEVPGVDDTLDCGLISIALDPEFETNGFVYLGYCSDRDTSGVYRFAFDPGDYATVGASGVPIIVLTQPNAAQPWHNVGWMGFDQTGTLFVLFGDKVHSPNAQDTSNALGAVARVLPSHDAAGGYEPAPGNPVEIDAMRAVAGYAWGLRSPWRGGFDRLGRLWIGDVGSDRIEEINLLTAADQNFGWDLHEGDCSENCTGLTDPSFWFDRSSTHPYVQDDAAALPTAHRVVWVASQYDPSVRDRYDGLLSERVLFGDSCTGFARRVWVDEQGAITADDPAGHLGAVAGIRQGPDGYLYATQLPACTSEKEGESGFVRVVLE